MNKLLHGEKVKLRAVEPEDVDLLMEWENKTSLWEISSTISPFSRKTLTRYVENAHLDIYEARQLRLMIDSCKNGKTLGTVDLFDFDPFHQRAGVGVLIAEENDRNNGFASEAIALVKDYCFKFLSLHQLYCNILEDNKPSLHLFEKAGFTISGEMQDWIRVGDDFKNQYFLQAFRDE